MNVFDDNKSVNATMPDEMPLIARRLDVLSTAVNDVREAVKSLSVRLEPVLSRTLLDSDPSPGMDESEASPVSQRLLEESITLCDLTQIIWNINRRLEI